MTDRLTVLYDADCGICTHTARLIDRLDSDRRLDLVPLQLANLPAMPSRTELGAALHAVNGHGQWFVGADALLEIARRVPSLRPMRAFVRLPLARQTVDALYGVVANNRQQLSRLLGLRACRVPSREA